MKSPSGVIVLIIIIVILIVLLGLRMAGIFTFDIVEDLNSSSNSFVNDIGKDYFDEIRKDNAVVENLNKLLSK